MSLLNVQSSTLINACPMSALHESMMLEVTFCGFHIKHTCSIAKMSIHLTSSYCLCIYTSQYV